MNHDRYAYVRMSGTSPLIYFLLVLTVVPARTKSSESLWFEEGVHKWWLLRTLHDLEIVNLEIGVFLFPFLVS